MNQGGYINGGALDLNNLPEDFAKQASQDTCSSGTGKRKMKGGSGGSSRSRKGEEEEEEEESGKVYECRFCSLKFSKSQSLGGHMNRHRQERETESLNKARQLVFGTENLAAAPPFPPPFHFHQRGGGYHQHHSAAPFMYQPARMFSSHHHQQQQQPMIARYPSQYPPPPHHHHHHQQQADHFVGDSYTCIGAPAAAPGPFMLNNSAGSSSAHHLNRFQDTSPF